MRKIEEIEQDQSSSMALHRRFGNSTKQENLTYTRHSSSFSRLGVLGATLIILFPGNNQPATREHICKSISGKLVTFYKA